MGAAREEMKKGGGMVDMTKDQLIEMRINQCLVEADGFDLIAMGQPEGPGCYCAANHLVARFMEVLGEKLSLHPDGQRSGHGAHEPPHHQ